MKKNPSKLVRAIRRQTLADHEALYGPTPKEKYGVYPHAEFINGEVRITPNGGYVVRTISKAVPYSRMEPIKIYARKSDADRLSDKLTYGTPRKNPFISSIFP